MNAKGVISETEEAFNPSGGLRRSRSDKLEPWVKVKLNGTPTPMSSIFLIGLGIVKKMSIDFQRPIQLYFALT